MPTIGNRARVRLLLTATGNRRVFFRPYNLTYDARVEGLTVDVRYRPEGDGRLAWAIISATDPKRLSGIELLSAI